MIVTNSGFYSNQLIIKLRYRRAQEEAAMAEGQRELHLAQQAAVLRMANKGTDPAYNGNVRILMQCTMHCHRAH
jgi:hypothetical protein